MVTPLIVLRPATIGDADLLLAWRNDGGTRHASHNTAEVSREEHVAWLNKVLRDGTRQLFIAEEEGVAVGTVRADMADGIHELSWTVAPEARGHGVAKRMVAALASQISEPLRAEIKADNTASVRVAEHAGMYLKCEADGILYYARGPIPR